MNETTIMRLQTYFMIMHIAPPRPKEFGTEDDRIFYSDDDTR